MDRVLERLRRVATEEDGSTATEYALIAALTAIFAIAGLTYFTSEVVAVWTYVAEVVGAAIGRG